MGLLTGQELAGRDVVVAGGTGNVGYFLVDGFLRAGARVIVPSRSGQKLERLQARLDPRSGDRLVGLVGDIGTPDGAVELQGQIRDVTDNLYAAVAAVVSWHQTASMVRSGFGDFARVIETGLFAQYLAAETLLPLLAEDGAYTTINGPIGFLGAPPPGLGPMAVVSVAQAKLIQAFAVETGGHPRVNDVVMMAFLGPSGTRPGSGLAGEQVGDFVALLSSPAAADVHGRAISLRDPRQVQAAFDGTFPASQEQ